MTHALVSKNPLRWVILLLVAAVILPTVCLLWFMMQAVENAQFAVRQKLIDMYTERAERIFGRLQDAEIAAHVEALETGFDSPASSAGALWPGFKCVLVFDTEAKMLWPAAAYDEPQRPAELNAVFQHELQGDFQRALAQYEAIAEGTAEEAVRHLSQAAQARCLARLNRMAEAAHLLHALSFPDLHQTPPELWPTILRNRVFLAELYERTGDKKLTDHLRRILPGEQSGREQQENLLSVIPAEMLVWYLDALIAIAQLADLEAVLAEEIAVARRLAEVCRHAFEIAETYNISDELNRWPVRTIRSVGDPALYALKLAAGDEILVTFMARDQVLRHLSTAAESVQDQTVGLKVYDSQGSLVAGDETPASRPFAAVAPGLFMPDWRVDLFFRDDSVFKDAAGRQAALYVWTGLLVIVLILTSGALAAGSLNRQIKLNRLKNDFIATVTHEIKTPLASMRVLVDTLLDGRYEDRRQSVEYLQLIARENLRLTRLIDSFLAFSRMDRNKHAFEIVPASAAEIARAAADAMQTRLNGDDCHFSDSVEPDLPAIAADKDAMVTVLINLLDNACKYTQTEKRIGLKVYAEGGDVCFAVSDNGVGMTPRQMKRVFERFYQADTSLSRRTQGAGLGLAIVKFICDAHHAKITIQSKPGEGSTFTIRLPKAERGEIWTQS